MAKRRRLPVPIDHLIVVGASAGGIEALSVFVGSLPANLAAPVVIAQHLDPTHPSHLIDILSRQTVLPVRSVESAEKLVRGTVYVVPSNHHVEIRDHEVRVHHDPTRRPTPSVDLLLATAAEVFGERLVAVILTGSGSDGAAGAHAVKAAGGTIVIQDPATAAFASMPRSLAAALVDAVLPLEEIGPFLAEIVAGSYDDAAEHPEISSLLSHLRDRHGIDFSAFKASTIQRRLQRRMAAVGVWTVAAYLDLLNAHPEEEDRIIADFLIKVTSFFRDPALFERLRETVLPELLGAAAEDERELRLWSAGCATGEEAYSLAMLVADLLDARSDAPAVRIFATDIDENALAFARRGIYSAAALANTPADLVARHFDERDGVYEARKSLRGLIVFGHHDLAQRPPFPHIDLVLCRNVLIYFTPGLQERALALFAYSLRDGGYLVLGKSETPGPADRSFTEVDRVLRMYRRGGPRAHLPPERLPSTPRFPDFRRAPVVSELSAPAGALEHIEADHRESQVSIRRAEDLVRRLPTGVVVVARNYYIETINGVAREWLGIHGLALGQDLIHLAQRVPSTALRAAIDAVARGDAPQRLPETVTVETAAGDTRHLAISCHPDRRDEQGVVETVLVLVEDVTSLELMRREGIEATVRAARLTEGNRELLAANRELTDRLDMMRQQSDELRHAAASAQVAAEEIETLNEELQSSNEELQTLHEESQATLEELNVANDQLQARAEETERLAVTHGAERARLAAILTSMADAVVVVDRTGRAVRSNAAYDDLVESVGELFVPAREFDSRQPSESTPQARAARGEAFRMDFVATGRDATERWFEATGRPLQDDEEGAGVVVIRDITERKAFAEQLLHQATHDSLTDLPNRAHFMQRLENALSQNASGRVAVLLLDLDRFKIVNDSLGHEFGDRCLVVAAERLASVLRPGDFLARFGGDEFTVLLDHIANTTDATRLAASLQEALAAPLAMDSQILVLSASLGIALSSPELTTPTDLLRAADVALYRAKGTGKGSRAFFDPAHDAEALARLDLENQLRLALERNELRLHYQPELDLTTGQMIGVEALVRWQRPGFGLVPPASFISIAEETGLIVPLGAWVLREACRQVMLWHKQYADAQLFKLSVNVSPVQIRQPGLVDQVESILREIEFPADHLVLEITEHGLVDASEAADRAIRAILSLGVRLAIDDFGAHQAGLGYLRRWPMSILKLDRTLVNELEENERSGAIVAAVVGLAKSLGMTVTGEGIETADQAAKLRTLGCHSGQGFAFARPLPPDDLVPFLERRSHRAP